MPATYEPIATTTLGSTQLITFSSIAASWTDLRIVLQAVQSAANSAVIRFNGDTATNYSNTELLGNGTAASSGRTTSSTWGRCSSQTGVSGKPSLHVIDIFNYAGSTFKTCLAAASVDQNGSGMVERGVVLWRSTAAITSITLQAQSVGFDSGTTATLYGIKAA